MHRAATQERKPVEQRQLCNRGSHSAAADWNHTEESQDHVCWTRTTLWASHFYLVLHSQQQVSIKAVLTYWKCDEPRSPQFHSCVRTSECNGLWVSPVWWHCPSTLSTELLLSPNRQRRSSLTQVTPISNLIHLLPREWNWDRGEEE